jgi:N-acetylmuramoyl-L-alanine amidase
MKTKKKLIYIVSFHSALILITASTCMDGLPKQSPSYYEILQIENSASQEVVKNAGYEVFLTRDNDSFVALDERTTQANKKKVDLFLSIHANAGSPHASGIETYWLDSKLLKNCNSIRNDTVQKLVVMKDTLSSLCAQCVHNAAIDAAKKIYNVNDRKVKTSVAQVLLGTDVMIPAALIEIGFLSNQKETKLLMDKAYQSTIAQGIANGIITYFSKCKKL